ncbi:MAG: hypothetical protein EZS28_012415 [Streblomastix strix]|uniref:Uncharacterized protein n=1 Tax=Streblomastix strix TaxID=222440 RepID=A0A5J4WAW7_9EUKA|nr:MAG: hypothetical protein EZS28_012415 [Streblomastix strix]
MALDARYSSNKDNNFIEVINKYSENVNFVPDSDHISMQINVDGRISECHTVSFAKVLEHGVYSIEMVIEKGAPDSSIGIAKASYDIPPQTIPWQHPHGEHIVLFGGKSSKPPGGVFYKGQKTAGNAGYKNKQILRMEFDSENGTLILFIDNIQQPVMISKINEQIRFIICLYDKGSQCNVHYLRQIAAPTSKHVPNEKFVEW